MNEKWILILLGLYEQFKTDLNQISYENARKALMEFKPTEQKESSDELITETELSKRLHRSKVTLNDWRKRGLLPFYRISRKIYYNWDEVVSSLKKIEKRGSNAK